MPFEVHRLLPLFLTYIILFICFAEFLLLLHADSKVKRHAELMSDVQVTQMKPEGTLEESGEARWLRKSLEEMSDEAKSPNLLRECGLSDSALVTISERLEENRCSWSEVKYLSDCLLLALDGSLEHALLVSF